QVALKDVNGTKLYSLDVTGEVLKDDQLFENYRYRFDYPADVTSDKLAVVFDRFLRPADYKARIRVRHVNSGADASIEKQLTVALNAKNEPITGDEINVNTGNDPFRVRIVAPRVAFKLRGKTRVEMAVAVPEGKKLDHVDLYLNQTRMASLYGPPYVQTIDVPATEGVGYLRAVANLKDDAQPPVEDLVMINTPQFMEEVNVHLVELPTTVTRNGRPVNDLAEASFKVLDGGKPAKVAKFEHVTNLA